MVYYRHLRTSPQKSLLFTSAGPTCKSHSTCTQQFNNVLSTLSKLVTFYHPGSFLIKLIKSQNISLPYLVHSNAYCLAFHLPYFNIQGTQRVGNQKTVWGLALPIYNLRTSTKLLHPVFIPLPFLSLTRYNTKFKHLRMFFYFAKFQIESF